MTSVRQSTRKPKGEKIDPDCTVGHDKLTPGSEMAAGLAHEIRSPLTTIKILLGTLAKKGAFSTESKLDLKVVFQQIDRIDAIVGAVLHSAQAEIRPSRMKPVDLSTVANETLLLLATSAREGTKLELIQKDGLLPVFGDGTQLSQAIYNLALNAIEATGKGGRVNISTGVVTEADNRKVYIEVADDGPGFNPTIQERLFTPFATTKEGGIGLGLLIVRRIVEAHQGELRIESPRADIGRGTRFTILLPELNEYQI